MRVDGCDPIFHTSSISENEGQIRTVYQSNVPIRIDIASRILASLAKEAEGYYYYRKSVPENLDRVKEYISASLFFADALIKAHNESLEE